MSQLKYKVPHMLAWSLGGHSIAPITCHAKDMFRPCPLLDNASWRVCEHQIWRTQEL